MQNQQITLHKIDMHEIKGSFVPKISNLNSIYGEYFLWLRHRSNLFQITKFNSIFQKSHLHQRKKY
jgi:maltodextrin utilization protein YvdJ